MSHFAPGHAAAWFEIPATGRNRSKKLYGAVPQNELADENAPNPMALFAVKDSKTGGTGHIHPGKPAPEGTGNTVHLAAPAPLDDAMNWVEENGGKVVSSIITISAGRFDPGGNSIGLFA
ncbi:VOC family protein [Chelativorans sp. YIM 93263]|uniref:VOC family protein n=1 Tax=Chelativorans sp. YIM 93263 TaxID=2906648 RepID=UPI0023780EA4|nr:VOC family protein [Chelativorans sp. YIM 93263]